MSFCPACGRQRTGNSRFCGGCGHDFGEQAADGGTTPSAVAAAPVPTAETAQAAEPVSAEPVPAAEQAPAAEPVPAAEQQGWDLSPEVTQWDRPADNTRWDAPADATRLEPSTADPASAKPAEPDPFAAWFAPQAPPAPADPWQAADTVYAAPNQPAGYPPPSRQGPVFPPPQGPFPPPQGPVGGPPPRRTSPGARAALIVLAVLIVLGAGGAAYALFPKSTKSAAVTSPPTTSSGATPTTQASATSSGSPSTSPTGSASAAPSPSVVSVAPGVGSNPATPQVETVLSHYFQGINTHNYAEYSSALDAQEQAKQSQSTFDSGYSTTTDSGMTLTSLSSTNGGGLAATVTFTSHQAASASVDNKSTCNHWRLTLYLVPQGTGYLEGTAPSGYQPTYSDC
jgi:hypothetical protein